MPDLFVYASEVSAALIKPHFKEIGLALREATASALPDLEGSSDVEAFLIPYAVGSNACQVQIMGVASYTADRESHIEEWRAGLAKAWTMIISEIGLEENFPQGEVEVWPTMPVAKWGSIPLKE